MSAPTETESNPDRLPWRINYEAPRVIVNCDGEMIGALDTPEASLLAVESANAGDVDARREVTRLRQMITDYRNRSRMSPSERQSYLDETYEQSIQPERYYMDTREQPIKDLTEALYGILVEYQVSGEKSPAADAVVAQARAALKTFDQSARRWML